MNSFQARSRSNGRAGRSYLELDHLRLVATGNHGASRSGSCRTSDLPTPLEVAGLIGNCRAEPFREGGIESVRALDPEDATQIEFIRSHLPLEAKKFEAGDFSDPTAIHGMAMPGVGALSAGAKAGRLAIEYAELPDGAKITYASDDPVLVAAIHDWFNAQLMDHGQHASSQ